MNYEKKYLKYKNKYLILKNLIGGECKKGFMENDEKFLKRGCKIELLPIIDKPTTTQENVNKENKKQNKLKLDKYKLQDLLLAYDINELLQVFNADEIQEKIIKASIESPESKIKFSKIINNGGRIIGLKKDKKNKSKDSEITEFENFWKNNFDYSDIVDDYKNFTSNPNKFFEHFKNFDVIQLEYDRLRVKILITKLIEAKVNNDLIAIAFLNGNINGEHLNLDNDKNKEILNLIYNVDSSNILNETFEKKFIQYAPNDINKIFYFSNYKTETFKEKLIAYSLVETFKKLQDNMKTIYINPKIKEKISKLNFTQ